MSKSFLYVLLSTFLLVLGTYISGTILTPYAQDLGATWFQIGILSGSMYVIRLIFGSPIGKLADRKGTLAVLCYSLLLYPFIAVAYYFSWNIYSLILARLLHGVASAMMLPMGMAYVGQASPEGKEGSYMSIYNFSVILASGLGPMLSTLIAGSFHNYKVTFLALFVLALLALLVIRFAYHEQAMKEQGSLKLKQNNRTKDKDRLSGKIALRSNGGFLALGFANIALAVVSSLVGFFFVTFLQSRGVKLKYTGIYIAVYYFISGIIQLPLGKLIDRHNKFVAAILAGFGTAASLMIFSITDSIILLCLAVVLTALTSASFLTAVSSLSVIIGRKQGMGNTMGLLNSVNSAGMIFGCICLGLLPGRGVSYELFFYFSSFTMILCTILFAIMWSCKTERTEMAE